MLNQDVTNLLEVKLAEERRPNDGKLHPSGDLVGSLRHAQLRAAGAPTVQSELISDVRLRTGTMWHSYFESVLAGQPVMTEVKLDQWLPNGWAGTADWIIWNPDYKAFVLGDLKTTKGEGMRYIKKEGIKTEHLWQASAYWYALKNMGIPLMKGFVIYYLPQNQVTDDPDLQPLLIEGQPLPEEKILTVMEARWAATEAYKREVQKELPEDYVFLNDYLAPEMQRHQAMRWNKLMGIWDVKLVPHWSTSYCPFPTELCRCRLQKTEKIGHFLLVPKKDEVEGNEWKYIPRKGYENIELEVETPIGKSGSK